MSIRFSLMLFYTLTYTKNIYDQQDDFKFLSVNFLFICSHIPAAPAYRVCISKLIRYSWDSYHDVRDRRLRLIMNILNKWLLLVKLNASSRLLYSRHHVLVNRYRIYVTNNIGIVPFVLFTILSFPNSGLITDQYDGCHQ
jgi:hypothetical protein